jgi:hypothetical protein
LLVVEVDQVDIEVVGAFGVREAKIQSHLLMLEWKDECLKMRENADQTFLFRQTIFDHLIADQEGLDAWLYDIRHERIL